MEIDDDMAFALKIEANEHGIYDENLIENLLDEFRKTKKADIDDILDENFDFEDNEQDIEYFTDSEDYQQNINHIYRYNTTDDFEIINNREQMLLRGQLNQIMNIPTLNQNSLFNMISSLGINSIPVSMNNGSVQIISFTGDNINNPFEQLLNNMNVLFSEPVPVALTTESLNKLEELTYDEVLSKVENLDKEEQCSICFSKLTENTNEFKYTILPCNHVFHSECIKTYLKDYNYQCPICKKECGNHEAKV